MWTSERINSHSKHLDYVILSYEAVESSGWLSVFRRHLRSPSSGLEIEIAMPRRNVGNQLQVPVPNYKLSYHNTSRNFHCSKILRSRVPNSIQAIKDYGKFNCYAVEAGHRLSKQIWCT
jgi:hypothetical protein